MPEREQVTASCALARSPQLAAAPARRSAHCVAASALEGRNSLCAQLWCNFQTWQHSDLSAVRERLRIRSRKHGPSGSQGSPEKVRTSRLCPSTSARRTNRPVPRARGDVSVVRRLTLEAFVGDLKLCSDVNTTVGKPEQPFLPWESPDQSTVGDRTRAHSYDSIHVDAVNSSVLIPHQSRFLRHHSSTTVVYFRGVQWTD